MRTMRILYSSLTTVFFCLSFSVTLAEVNGYDPTNSGGLTGSQPLILGTIGDDADPTGFIWTRFHSLLKFLSQHKYEI